ncbi:hypothetical protein [Massilia sp. CF038]|uniref:hypothetical protein n=1 Tax=Massilia sp. CF038 TaxID=1881045 RepID=UPI00092050DC|nr:hypothetical protein [Massilia sp. CF038]SHH45239.1 hypothetical protein SAMN05428948_4094 [Massilia sp. CF038]
MKRLLNIAMITALSAAALLPLSASADSRVRVTINAGAPVYSHAGYTTHERVRYYQPAYVYAPAPRYYRDDRYVQQRQWGERSGYGSEHRRGRRDLDRDGIADRYDRDLDNDGVPNRYDRDMDGDGVRNRYDRRPDNRYRY